MAERILERNIPKDRSLWTDTRALVLDDVDPPDAGGRRITIPAISDRIFPTKEPQDIEISPALPKNSPLERAGFLLYRQMVNFIGEVNRGNLSQAIVELITEVRAHANEYTREAPLLIGNVKKTEKGMVNKYNNEPVINHLDWTEREGATARGNVDLNNRVLEASERDLDVLVSPSGWNGKYPDYEKTQIVFVHDKGRGDLDQLTFVLNFKLENCVVLLERMGVSEADLVCADRKQTIKKMVSQAVHLGSEIEISEPRIFLRLLKGINPYDPNFRIIERDLERHLNGEDISVLASDCEKYLQELEAFLFQNAGRLKEFNVQAEYSDRVEETIYKIAQYIRGYGKVARQTRMNTVTSYHFSTGNDTFRLGNWRDEYREIIGVLQMISGCAGGGSRSMRALGGIFSSGLLGSSYASFEVDQYGSLEFDCEKCKRKNRRPKGGLLDNCQHCGANTVC